MNGPLVSVIVPVYRAEAYLRTCIDSILAQTYPHLEVLLVDDGSPDRCPAICDAYAQQDARVRVIHQKNAGACAARNAALDVCRGAYITFVDSDDFVHPRYVELLWAVLWQQQADLAVAGFTEVSADAVPGAPAAVSDVPVQRVSGRDACRMLHDPAYWTRIVVPWGKLIPRRAFDRLRFPAIPCHEDEALMYKVFYPQKEVVFFDAPLYFYRTTPGSLAHRPFSEKDMVFFPVFDERTRYYESHQDVELALQTTSTAFYTATYYYTTFFDKALTPRLADLQKKYYRSLLRRKPGFRMVCAYTGKYISSRFFVRFAAKKH